ncbi:inorganic phosphate transporter PitA [Candidatus Curculioniphilus buchneri]|uniref:inorganic phosphate transporter PitA n=1 Tax=Candidatus Curculioniphilus buchneri TaxID=690594 RepID=UPI00376EC6D8
MLYLFTGLELHTGFMLVLTLIFVLLYEVINGFHDTANSVATVIYTRALRSQSAVIMSGILNFFGVIMGGISVAYTIIHLLPTDLLLNISSTSGLAMMFSILLSAILWNLSTWYFGLPASSSHTLIGAIIGVGLTNALITNSSIMKAMNIPKLIEIFLSLIISPIIGLLLAGLTIFFLRRNWKNKKIFGGIHITPEEWEQKNGKRHPPFWTRIALILSAAGVSFSHGANDGQKGIGLIMLVLISVVPAGFVINMNANSYDIHRIKNAVNYLQQYCIQHHKIFFQFNDAEEWCSIPRIAQHTFISPLSTGQNLLENHQNLTQENTKKKNHCCNIEHQVLLVIDSTVLVLNHLESYNQLNPYQRSYVRRVLIYLTDVIDRIIKFSKMTAEDKYFLANLRRDLLCTIEYSPVWIIIAVALSLSLGTMIGWRRVTITIGEKIGKKNMTYAQGLSAQITTAISIGIASYTGMPVSTTHVLSSAVTGTMIADGNGIQGSMVKQILLAWILTLPVAIVLSGSLYWLVLKLI